VPKPDELDVMTAGALPLAGATALAVVEAVSPDDGDSVLIVGAGGGVGSFAVELAAKRGATIIATARGDDDTRLRLLGAAETIDFTSGDLGDVLRERYPNGVDALIDLATRGDGFAELAAHVRDGGRIASTLGGSTQ
jgi:NADPH:quinone reductase-like Zn-dependent oxidoreductase